MKFVEFQRGIKEQVELEITPLMNLMIILVPILLISLNFAQITVLEVNLPELTGGMSTSQKSQSKLEVRIENTGFKVFFPEDVLIQEIPLIENDGGKSYDFMQLSKVLQAVKGQLSEKRDILLLSHPNVDYQNLVFTMDAVKSFSGVVATNLVEIELFPEISLGDII
ncbi:MAG: biopolymer transporter ExbD [Pseudomonadota bacterium]